MKQFLRARIADWARRRQGPDAPPFTLHSRRIYILPTRLGLAFGAMLAIMTIAGLNYANSAALFLTFLLAGFALVSMHQTHRNLLRTSFVTASAPPMFAGTPGNLYITLGNDARCPRYGFEITALEGKSGNLDIPIHAQAQTHVPLPASKRGVLRIDRLHIATSFPYNLFRAWTWVHLPLEVLVYPRPHGSAPMPTESGLKTGSRAMALAGADEWRSLRPFRDGDSPRQGA